MIRRELDELMLDEACSASAAEHLKECSACREFHQTRTKLRQMVGSLGTVAAPADFDFRLRARLAANGSSREGFHYWAVARRGLAFAAVLAVFATGIIVVRNVVNQQTAREAVADRNRSVPQPTPQQVMPVAPNAAGTSNELTVQQDSAPRIRTERSVATGPRVKRHLATIDSASTGAEVISGSNAVDFGATAVILIDPSLPTLKFSLDDGSGNARTISVPTIRFGSQRMLPNGNQFAQKGVW